MSEEKAIPVNFGFIGLGVMGRWMCQHLLTAGHKGNVYNRTVSKAEPLKALGAIVCGSPKEVAEKSDVVFSIVGYPADVRDVVLGERGVLKGLKKGGIVVDLTTSEPKLAREIFDAAKAVGVGALDAPVSGGDVGAREARLSIMVGGEREVFDRVLPLLKCMGKNITLMGPAGSGQFTKLTNQIVIASTMVGVCEALLFAHKSGLDVEQTINAIGGGAASSWSLLNLGPRIAKKNFDPGFFVEHFIKDLGIALDEAKRMKLSLPGLALANQLYLAVSAQGHERLGTHALFLGLEHLNSVKQS